MGQSEVYDPDLLSGTTDDYVVNQQKENKHCENVYLLLSWETAQQEVTIVWVLRHRSLQHGNGQKQHMPHSTIDVYGITYGVMAWVDCSEPC